MFADGGRLNCLIHALLHPLELLARNDRFKSSIVAAYVSKRVKAPPHFPFEPVSSTTNPVPGPYSFPAQSRIFSRIRATMAWCWARIRLSGS